jgi:hypothetical protein
MPMGSRLPSGSSLNREAKRPGWAKTSLLPEVDAEHPGVVDQGVALTGVEEDPLPFPLDEGGEAVFADEAPRPDHRVLAQDRDGGFHVPPPLTVYHKLIN